MHLDRMINVSSVPFASPPVAAEREKWDSEAISSCSFVHLGIKARNKRMICGCTALTSFDLPTTTKQGEEEEEGQ